MILYEKQLGIIITCTPMRISFFGGGTDFPDFFNNKRGAVLGAAINKYTYVAINSLERLLAKKIKVSYSKLEMVENVEELEDIFVKSILSSYPHLNQNSFLDIHSFGDLPSGTGVGSSSSFTVGMINALYSLNGIYRPPELLAKEAINIERFELNQHGGWQDQIFAAYGGFNFLEFNNNMFTVNPVAISPEKKRALESACILVFTNSKRSSSDIQKSVFNKNSVSDKGIYLNRILEIVDEAKNIICNASEAQKMIKDFGRMLHESWQVKRSLSYNISNPVIDEIYQKAIDAGAYGGKICGAGGGGFILFIVPEENYESVSCAMKDLKKIKINFENMGSRVIFAKYKQ